LTTEAQRTKREQERREERNRGKKKRTTTDYTDYRIAQIQK
jgi:hypothetical protein